MKRFHRRQEQFGFLLKRDGERIDPHRRHNPIAMDRLPGQDDLIDGNRRGPLGNVDRQVGDTRDFFEGENGTGGEAPGPMIEHAHSKPDVVLVANRPAVTLAIADGRLALLLQEIFTTEHFRVYTHDDVVGVEVGAALKNVIAIASGISDGLGLGHNARAALITRGLAVIARLGVSMEAKLETFAGLSGLGDLVLTCTGALSRNYTVGRKLAEGEHISDILSRSRSVAEGVPTTRSAYQLSQRYSIEMPITTEVYRTLYEDKNPRDAVMDLMTRAPKPEFYG